MAKAQMPLARADVFDYIEISYNGADRHSHLGETHPEAFESASKCGFGMSTTPGRSNYYIRLVFLRRQYLPMFERINRFLVEDFVYYLQASPKKPLTKQVQEMYQIYRYYGFIPYQYLKHALYLESFTGNIFDYIPPELIHRLQHTLNPQSHVANVTDKEKFARLMKKGGLPVVASIFTVKPGPLFQDTKGHDVSFQDFKYQLKDFKTTNVFIIKPTCGYQGRGVIKTTIQNSDLYVDENKIDEPALNDLLFRKTGFEGYLVQPLIKQHEMLNRINPSSVNTIRIDTLVTHGNVVNNGAVLRVGNGKTLTDNWAMGGLIVPIDLESGTLGRVGKTKSKYGRQSFETHPMTGFRFFGNQLPFWAELQELVYNSALCLLPLKVLGWDIVITPTGPLLLEANEDYDVFLLQEGVGGLRGTPIGQQILKDWSFDQ
jgi:hypothetical protein